MPVRHMLTRSRRLSKGAAWRNAADDTSAANGPPAARSQQPPGGERKRPRDGGTQKALWYHPTEPAPQENARDGADQQLGDQRQADRAQLPVGGGGGRREEKPLEDNRPDALFHRPLGIQQQHGKP